MKVVINVVMSSRKLLLWCALQCRNSRTPRWTAAFVLCSEDVEHYQFTSGTHTHIYIYTHTYTRTHTIRAHTHKHTHVHTYTRARMHTHTRARARTHTHRDTQREPSIAVLTTRQDPRMTITAQPPPLSPLAFALSSVYRSMAGVPTVPESFPTKGRQVIGPSK